MDWRHLASARLWCHLGLAALLVPLALSPDRAAAVTGDPPPGRIRFRGYTAVGPSEGEFRRWHIVEARVDDTQPGVSEIRLAVDLSSVDTANDVRDRHLRGPDFLDVERYPVAQVRLWNFRLLGEDRFSAQVDIELHGRRHTIEMSFEIQDRVTRRISGRATLSRAVFGIGPGDGWGANPLRVRDEIDVEVDAVIPPPSVPSP